MNDKIRKIVAILFLLSCGVAFYSAPSGSRGFIHPPKWADTAGPYDPDQIITTTLHDYVKSGKH
ncbi:MAG: hypothetical protein AAGC81_16460, partial [Pseudomonadota bacterium]